MADKTFGVKVSDELNDKVRDMIEASGITAKEWFEKAVALTELTAIKQGATDYTQDLSELEVHTTRMYEIISNMIQRSIYIKDHAVKEYADKLEQRETIISEYQEKTSAAVEKAKMSDEAVKVLEKEKEDLSKQLEELRSVNHNNQLLIDEYKEKNDTLSGLVNKYQAFADENEELKKQYAVDTERMKTSIQEYKETVHDQQTKVNQLTGQIETMKRDHEIELERMSERKDTEKERAVIEIERDYQARLLAANEDYNSKLRESYAEITALRNQYEERIEKLQQPKAQTKDK
jgi:chromosome segregation ATPase